METHANEPRREFVKPLAGAMVSLVLFYVLFDFFLGPVIAAISRPFVGLTIGTLLAGSVACALAMAIFESRRLTELGLDFNAVATRSLWIGIALGAGAALSIILTPVAFGAAHFQRVANPDISIGGDLFMPVLLFCGAMGEEFAFRGFTLQYLARGWGMWPAILFTGALFGLMHGYNPDAGWLSTVNTSLFGVLFGVAVMRTHELWLPIGIHFGWNVTLPFLGTTLSGLTIRVTEYEWRWNTGGLGNRNIYWSGGQYGPEASILATAVILLLLAVLWKLPLARGRAWLLDAVAGESHDSPPQSLPSQRLFPPG